MADYRNNSTVQGSRGLRNNNPMNLRPVGFTYEGQTGVDGAGHAIFSDTLYGLRAGAMELYVNYVKHGFDTLYSTISDFAPASDGNDVTAYVNAVSKASGFAPFSKFPLNGDALKKIMAPMIAVELGSKYAKYIPAADIAKGINLLNKDALKVGVAAGGGLFLGLILFGFYALRKSRT